MLLWNPDQKMWSFSVSAVGSDRGLPSSHLAPTCLWFWPTGGPVPFTLFPSRDVVLLLLFHFPVCIEATRVFMIFFSLSASANFTVKKNKILRARKWNPKRPTEGCAINWNMIDICSPDVRKVGLFGTNPNKRHIVVLLVVFFFVFFFSADEKLLSVESVANTIISTSNKSNREICERRSQRSTAGLNFLMSVSQHII